jgi:hypothetical protein
MRPNTLVVGMVAVGAAFVLVLTLGFRIQQSQYKLSDDLFGWIAGLSIAVIAGGVTLAMLRFQPPRVVGGYDQAAHRENSRKRIAQLAANPATAKYARMMERGGYWTDVQIAYTENPNATATCVHLQPIEHGIRQAGITPYLFTEAWEPGSAAMPRIQVDCRINEVELQRRFPLAESVRYDEGYQPERHESDNPYARLYCTACQSSIDLVHPRYPGAQTKWFP